MKWPTRCRFPFANNVLLARKLVEKGVRFVQLFDWGWDAHGTDANLAIDVGMINKCRQIDKPITALLLDLKRKGATLLVVTHNIPSARTLGDELVFLHEGKVIARGSAESLERSDHVMVREFMQSEGAG